MRVAGRLIITLGTIATSGLALTACGSGGRQDANEPTGKFPVAITTATFPSRQRLAQHTVLTIRVRNTGHDPLPNVSVTICNVTCTYHRHQPLGWGTSVAPFADYLNMPGLASHSRPVWIVDRPPGPCGYSCANGGAGSYFTSASNTWAAGQLMPGHTATFAWGVTAVASGAHTVAWQVSAGLYGKARAVLANGLTPKGAFRVRITQAPAQSYVTSSGKVVTQH
jgi:hypothetical protein